MSYIASVGKSPKPVKKQWVYKGLVKHLVPSVPASNSKGFSFSRLAAMAAGTEDPAKGLVSNPW